MPELTSVVRFRFHEGKVEEFKRLSAICMEIVREQDPGTLQYDTWMNADESEAIVIERFRDEAALVEHSRNIGDDLMARIVATADCHGELLGDISDELRQNFDPDGPVQLLSPYSTLSPGAR